MALEGVEQEVEEEQKVMRREKGRRTKDKEKEDEEDEEEREGAIRGMWHNNDETVNTSHINRYMNTRNKYCPRKHVLC